MFLFSCQLLPDNGTCLKFSFPPSLCAAGFMRRDREEAEKQQDISSSKMTRRGGLIFMAPWESTRGLRGIGLSTVLADVFAKEISFLSFSPAMLPLPSIPP